MFSVTDRNGDTFLINMHDVQWVHIEGFRVSFFFRDNRSLSVSVYGADFQKEFNRWQEKTREKGDECR